MTTEEREFCEWLEKNKTILADRMVDEIAYIAIHQAMFDPDVVFKILPHWIVDRDTHTTYPIREAWNVNRELDHVTGLKEQWDYLGRHLTQGRDFND